MTSTPATAGAPGPAAAPFRWADVPAPDRDWLRARTDDIVGWAYRSACDAVRIGAALNDARKRLRRGTFDAWVRDHLPFSRPTAHRLRQVARCFAGFAASQFETFDESALYLLAQEKAPAAARAQAVDLARGGARVTRAVALQLLDAHKPVAVDRAAQAEYEALRGRLFKLSVEGHRGELVRVNQDAVTARQEGQDDGRRLAVGRMLEELVAAKTTVRVEKVDDPEDVVLYSVTTYSEADGPRNVVDRDLGRALARAAGVVATKHCPGCCRVGDELPAGRFGANKNSGDRLNPRCKACERRRKRDRRAQARAAKPAA